MLFGQSPAARGPMGPPVPKSPVPAAPPQASAAAHTGAQGLPGAQEIDGIPNKAGPVPLGPDGKPDIEGEADRNLARLQLAGKFQVVGGDYAGPRNHNTVSPEEYDRICKAYSDIRLGRGDLTIDASEFAGKPDEAKYKSGVMDSIGMMMQTTAGRNQIFGLGNNVKKDDAGNAVREDGSQLGEGEKEVHRHTTIKPLHQDANNDGNRDNDKQAPLDNTNAFAEIADPGTKSGAEVNATRAKWYRDAPDKRGQGADANIFWNPSVEQGTGIRADVVMAHEMEHVRHETQGTMAKGSVSHAAYQIDQSHGINNSEHQAVGLGHFPGDSDGCTENTYRQQRNDLGENLPLRQSYAQQMHPNWMPMPAAPPVPHPISGTGDVTAKTPVPTPVSGPADSTQKIPAPAPSPAPVPTPVSGPADSTQKIPTTPTTATAPKPTLPFGPPPVPTHVSGANDTTQRLPGVRKAS